VICEYGDKAAKLNFSSSLAKKQAALAL
jgi:hypothetical protein